MIEFIFVFLLAGVLTVQAQSAREGVRTLSLAESLRIALEHNFDIRIEEKEVDIAQATLRGAYGEYDPSLRAGVTQGHSLSPGSIDAQNRPFAGTTTDQESVSAGLGGLLPTGLSYDLSAGFQDSSGSTPSGLFENTSGSAAIQVRQPLLKNFWIDVPRLNILVNKRALKISELALRGRIMTTVMSVELAYYDLLLARERLNVQEQALQLAEKLLAANRERIKQGVMAALDEKQAESQVSAQRSFVLVARGEVGARENVLKGLLSDHLADWQDVAIEPSEVLTAVSQEVKREESWKLGLSLRPDLLQARENFERLGYVAKFNRNQLLPQVDLVGTYGRSASDQEFSGAFGQIQRGSSPFYSYGLQVSIPLSRRAAKENYRISRSQREQSELRLKQLEQTILLEIDDAVRMVETDFDRVGATRDARQFAEVALDAEQTKMDNGIGTSFVVLQLQRDLTAARSQEVQALAEYNKALAVLALREGTLLRRHRLELEVR